MLRCIATIEGAFSLLGLNVTLYLAHEILRAMARKTYCRMPPLR
jgi:hypothetical protein